MPLAILGQVYLTSSESLAQETDDCRDLPKNASDTLTTPRFSAHLTIRES